MPEQLEGIANIHLDALEHNNTIAFMHAVQDGAASKSYGLAVAALAGVPQSVIKLAKQKLTKLEKPQVIQPINKFRHCVKSITRKVNYCLNKKRIH